MNLSSPDLREGEEPKSRTEHPRLTACTWWLIDTHGDRSTTLPKRRGVGKGIGRGVHQTGLGFVERRKTCGAKRHLGATSSRRRSAIRRYPEKYMIVLRFARFVIAS